MRFVDRQHILSGNDNYRFTAFLDMPKSGVITRFSGYRRCVSFHHVDHFFTILQNKWSTRWSTKTSGTYPADGNTKAPAIIGKGFIFCVQLFIDGNKPERGGTAKLGE